MPSNKLMSMIAIVLLISVIVAACSSGNTENNQPSGVTNAEQPEQGSSENDDGATTESNVYDNGLPKDQEVTLKVAALESGYGREPYEVPAQKFMELFPNVKIEMTLSPTIRDIVTAKLAAKDDEDMFDLMFTPAGYSDQLAADGYVEPLGNDLLGAPTWDDPSVTLGEDFYPSIQGASSYNNVMYRMPVDLGLLGILYNKKMFQDNGWNEKPQTWNEFLGLAEQIQSSGTAVPYAFTGVYPVYASWPFDTAAMYVGGDEWLQRYWDRTAGIYSEPATLAPFVKWAEFVDKGYVLKGSEALNHTQSQMEFVQGNVAMIPGGSWIENEMQESTPEGFEFGFMIPPTNDAAVEKKYLTGTVNSLWAYAKKPDLNKQWTKEFLRFWYSQENMGLLIEHGGVPAVRSALSPDNVETATALFRESLQILADGNVDLYMSQLVYPEKLKTTTIAKDITNDLYYQGYLAVFLKATTPEQLGKDMDDVLEKKWAEVGGR